MDTNKLTKKALVDLLLEYDKYILNYSEPWDKDRQPVCIEEFFANEYECLCPYGGNEHNDCDGCIYSGDFHFVNGECMIRT